MNESLRKKIVLMRSALKADPSGPVAGDLPLGVTSTSGGPTRLGGYADFLAQCDGGRCGSVDFWSLTEIAANQYRISGIPGIAGHLCIGQVLYEPLVLDLEGDKVSVLGHPSESQRTPALGTLEQFLDTMVFGPEYPQLVDGGQDDEWYTFLLRTGLA